jgi:hypothetical protein
MSSAAAGAHCLDAWQCLPQLLQGMPSACGSRTAEQPALLTNTMTRLAQKPHFSPRQKPQGVFFASTPVRFRAKHCSVAPLPVNFTTLTVSASPKQTSNSLTTSSMFSSKDPNRLINAVLHLPLQSVLSNFSEAFHTYLSLTEAVW